MKKIKQLILVCSLFLIGVTFNNAIYGQCCDNCPQDLPDGDSQIFNVFVVDDAATPDNECEVTVDELGLNFTHQYIADLNITVISPCGNSAILIGDGAVGSGSGPTDDSAWNINFVDGAAAPDPNLPAVFDVQDADWGTNTTYTGTYNPNTGTIAGLNCPGGNCGAWEFVVEDVTGSDSGVFTDFGLSSGGAGLNCTSVMPACAIFNDLTTAPAAPTFVDAACAADGITLNPGSIDYAGTTCPAGATLQYSSDGGATWGITPVTYDDAMAITVDVRCLCDEDGMTVSPPASITTNPGVCVAIPSCTIDAVGEAVSACDDGGTDMDPADDTAIVTIDPAGTFDDGAGNTSPLAGTYTVTGLPTTTMGTFGTAVTETVPADAASYTITISYTDPNDPNVVCTAMATITAPASCSNAMNPPLVIMDPCNCTNGLDLDMDGQNEFALETITVSGGDGNYSIQAVSVSGLFDATGAALTEADLAINAMGVVETTSGGMVYVDGLASVPYSIIVEDGTGATVSQTGNICAPCPAPPMNDIPTLSEWGLITLALLLMSFGAVKMAVGSVALNGVGSTNIPMPGGQSFRLPFDSVLFRRVFQFTGVVALIGFAICFALYGAIFLADIIGVAIAGPVFAYLIHLLILLEKNNK